MSKYGIKEEVLRRQFNPSDFERRFAEIEQIGFEICRLYDTYTRDESNTLDKQFSSFVHRIRDKFDSDIHIKYHFLMKKCDMNMLRPMLETFQDLRMLYGLVHESNEYLKMIAYDEARRLREKHGINQVEQQVEAL